MAWTGEGRRALRARARMSHGPYDPVLPREFARRFLVVMIGWRCDEEPPIAEPIDSRRIYEVLEDVQARLGFLLLGHLVGDLDLGGLRRAVARR